MRFLALFALVLALSAPMAPSLLAQDGGGVAGTYAVHGTNRNGTTYTGTVVIKPEGSRLRFSWLIANGDTFKGVGTRQGDTIVVNWGQRYPVIYEVGADGVLHGKWDNGRASETLLPKPK
jgi:uncharacterized membrane protein